MANITPQTYDLEFTKNDDWYFEIKVWADNEKTEPFQFDANWSAILQVKKRSYGNPVIIEFKTSDSTMLLTTGLIILNQPKTKTDIPAELYYHDIEFNDNNDRSITYIKASKFLVNPEISDGSGL